ncbi:hypothetical protein HHK36_018578 [Tetracentron sinense]|uniref:Uncharacterized protein n=1 Tax=Tetracentron sinense TaxID=13715 RepID=A0A835DAY7_TETSI|nr:hypothetical protein HHK36_018578 [Tetracentron sinense]
MKSSFYAHDRGHKYKDGAGNGAGGKKTIAVFNGILMEGIEEKMEYGRISYNEFASMMKTGTDWRKASGHSSRSRADGAGYGDVILDHDGNVVIAFARSSRF